MKNKEVNIGYKIDRIMTTKFSFNELENENLDELFTNDNRLKINLNVNFNISKENSSISFEIESTLVDSLNNIDIIYHKGKTEFGIEGLEQTYRKEDESYDLPDNLIIQLYGISYTHARALLTTELSPTIYKNRYFLPVIDPSSIINK